jgi:hypothetical protein
MSWVEIISLSLSGISVLAMLGGVVYVSGKMAGRFDGHEAVDNTRFENVTFDIKEVKDALLTVQQDIKTLLSR